MCVRKRSSGFTLMEILIAAGLTLLLLGILSRVVGPALRAAAANAAKVDLQQQAVLALTRVSEELQKAEPGAVAVLAGGGPSQATVLSVHPTTDATASTPATLVYAQQLWVYCYRPDAHTLTRRVWPVTVPASGTLDGVLAPPSALTPLRPRASSLQYFADHPDPTEIRLARDVVSFVIANPGRTPSVLSPLKLTLELETIPAGRSTPLRFKLSQTVSLRSAES